MICCLHTPDAHRVRRTPERCERTRVRRVGGPATSLRAERTLWPSAPPRSIAPSSHARRARFVRGRSDEPRKWQRGRGGFASTVYGAYLSGLRAAAEAGRLLGSAGLGKKR